MNSVLVTVQVWHSRTNHSGYLEKPGNQEHHQHLSHTVPLSYKVHSYTPHHGHTTPGAGCVFCSFKGPLFCAEECVEHNINFGCQCVHCRHWVSWLKRTDAALLLWNAAHLKKTHILLIPVTPKYLIWKKKKGIVIWKNFTSGSDF